MSTPGAAGPFGVAWRNDLCGFVAGMSTRTLLMSDSLLHLDCSAGQEAGQVRPGQLRGSRHRAWPLSCWPAARDFRYRVATAVTSTGQGRLAVRGGPAWTWPGAGRALIVCSEVICGLNLRYTALWIAALSDTSGRGLDSRARVREPAAKRGSKTVVNAQSNRAPASARAVRTRARTFGRAASWSAGSILTLLALLTPNRSTTWWEAWVWSVGAGIAIGLIALWVARPHRRSRLLDFLTGLAAVSLLTGIIRRLG